MALDQPVVDRAALVDHGAPRQAMVAIDGDRAYVDDAPQRGLPRRSLEQVARGNRRIEHAAGIRLLDAGRQVVDDRHALHGAPAVGAAQQVAGHHLRPVPKLPWVADASRRAGSDRTRHLTRWWPACRSLRTTMAPR